MANENEQKIQSVPTVLHNKNQMRKNNLLNFLLSVRLRYVKLGYHYLISNALYLFLIPIGGMILTHLSTLAAEDFFQLCNELRLNFVTVILCSFLLVFASTIYLMGHPRKVFLVNFAYYKAEPDLMCSKELLLQLAAQTGNFTEGSLAFKKKILERSGIGQTSYGPETLMQIQQKLNSVAGAREETKAMMIGAIDELLAKTVMKPRDMGIFW